MAANEVIAAPERPSEPEPESEPDASPPTNERVTITISTKVPAQILDAADEAILGSIPGDPLVLDRADEPLVLIVRAEGHEDLEIRVVPDRDKQFEPTLVLESAKGKKKKPKRRPDGTPEVGKTDGVVELDASPNPTPAEKYVPPELRNPFGKGKKKKSG